MIKFKDWIFSRLPSYFSQKDTYKDNEGRGLFERLLRAHGEELDQNLVEPLETMAELLDPIIAPEKFLPHIAYTLGSPPDFSSNDEVYRALLKNIIGIYQIKGTYLSYLNLFRILGFNLTLITVFFRNGRYYDSGLEYDDPEVLYDDVCNSCVDYTIFISPLDADCNNPQDQTLLYIDEELLKRFKEIACFLEPINANLIGIYTAIPVCESTSIHISEEITLTIYEEPLYDNEENYD